MTEVRSDCKAKSTIVFIAIQIRDKKKSERDPKRKRKIGKVDTKRIFARSREKLEKTDFCET